MTYIETHQESQVSDEVPSEPPPRYSALFSDSTLAPPRYSSTISPRSRSHSSTQHRSRGPSPLHRRYNSSTLYPDPLAQLSTLNPHAPDFALASNSAYPHFINGSAHLPTSPRRSPPPSSKELTRHHFHLKHEGRIHRHLSITNDSQKALYDATIAQSSASFSKTYRVDIASALPSALISSSCIASICLSSSGAVAFTVHAPLVVVCSGNPPSKQDANGFEFASSDGMGVLRWVNGGENRQRELTLKTSGGINVARLSSWRKGSGEEGKIKLLSEDVEQTLVEEIVVSGLLALNQERWKSGALEEGGGGGGGNVAWTAEDFGMADWGYDCGGRSGWAAGAVAGRGVAAVVLGAFW